MLGLNPFWRAMAGIGGDGEAPTLDLNFAGGTMPAGLTFSRASNATMIGPDGLLQWAPHNLLQQSQFPSGISSAWTPAGATAALTANYSAAPDGSATAARFVSATIGHGIRQHLGITVSGQVTGSVYVVSNTGSNQTIALRYFNNSGQVSQTFTVTNVWQRISLADLTAIAGGNFQFDIQGVGATDVLIWGAQLNIGPLQPYYPTTGAPYYGPRIEYDPLTLECKGLLMEPAGTNSLRSPASWVPGNAVSAPKLAASTYPGGIYELSTLATSGQSEWYDDGASLPRSTAAVFSIDIQYVDTEWVIIQGVQGGSRGYWWVSLLTLAKRAGGNLDWMLTAESTSDGWVRITSTLPADGSGLNWKPNVWVVGANGLVQPPAVIGSKIRVRRWQLETGPVATSYIPTAGASATRADDLCSLSAAAWYSPVSGTLVAEYSSAANRYAAELYSSVGNRVVLQDGVIASAGPNGTKITAVPSLPGVKKKQAVAWSSATGEAVGAQNGVAYSVATAGAFAPFSTLSIGSYRSILGSPVQITGGAVSRIRYYRTALPATRLQALTA